MNQPSISKIITYIYLLFLLYSLVANTLSKLNDNRRCFRKIGDNLVEKDLDSIKKDLKVEIANIKQTLDVVYKTMTQQENILN